MTTRRFDTDTLLGKLLENDEDAFRSFYERYRGRVYRFIVRQCGNGEQGQQAYLSVWAQLINNRLTCGTDKALKRAFLKSLQDCSLNIQTMTINNTQFTPMPRELEAEGGWSTLLVELIKQLPEGHRKRLLFRYEIGLSLKAIASLFGEERGTTKTYLGEAEGELLHGLSLAGCSKKVSLHALYRETRLLKSPASWDDEIIESYPDWLKQGVPASLIKIEEIEGTPDKIEFMKTNLMKALDQLKYELSERTYNFKYPTSNRS